jgi:CO/xanthine dehydrogenase FAD-binding subunit
LLVSTALNPPDDYKGSQEYRRALAEIVAARALAELA